MLGAILTLKISRVMETLVFGSGWVVGITPYVHFCPIPRPLLSCFHSIGNFTILPLFIKCKSVFFEKLGGDSHNPSQPKNKGLHHSRNFEGQNRSQHTVWAFSSKISTLEHTAKPFTVTLLLCCDSKYVFCF